MCDASAGCQVFRGFHHSQTMEWFTTFRRHIFHNLAQRRPPLSSPPIRSIASSISTELPRITTMPTRSRLPSFFSSRASSSTRFRKTYEATVSPVEREIESNRGVGKIMDLRRSRATRPRLCDCRLTGLRGAYRGTGRMSVVVIDHYSGLDLKSLCNIPS